MGIFYENYDEKLNSFISGSSDRLIGEWINLCRQPSISSTGEGIDECCKMIVDKMEDIGIETEVYPIKPYPVIIGKYGNDPGKSTLLIYAHYDVQPPDPLNEWKTPAFACEVIDGVCYGRGTADCKGPLMAHLHAAEFFINELGDVPLNLKFIFEGCEENSSAGLPEFLTDNREMLDFDMVYLSDGCRHESGLPTIALGAKGLLYIELVMKRLVRDVHSMYAAVLPNAAWDMVGLLNKIKSDGIVHVPGFYDDVAEATPLEREFYNRLPSVAEQLLKNFGSLPEYAGGKDYYEQLCNTPTMNISGLTSGYSGKGGKTILPAEVRAKLDIRLVANQSTEDIYQKICKYIKDLGYNNVEVIKHGTVEPSKTPIETPFLPYIEQAAKEVFGDYIVYPCRPGTAPDYLWSVVLKKPSIQVRWCDADSSNHSPNEHLKLSTYIDGVRSTARVIKVLGEKL